MLFAGSVWPADVAIIQAAWPQLRDRWRLVLAPHQLDEVQLAQWQEAFGADRYTGPDTGSRVLLLDTIGILSRAYRYGTVAFIGGGYGKAGLHNTLEPLSYGLPVLFGPFHQKFPEAGEAIGRGGAFVIESSSELVERLTELSQQAAYAASKRAQLGYLDQHRGAAPPYGRPPAATAHLPVALFSSWCARLVGRRRRHRDPRRNLRQG